MKQNEIAAQTANETKGMHPGVKFIITCGAITVLVLVLQWVYYESGWDKNLRQGIVIGGGLLVVCAGATAFFVYLNAYYQYLKVKRALRLEQNQCFPQKYLYPSGIILLALGRQKFEGYFHMFCRLKPSKHQCEIIRKNEDHLMLGACVGAILFGIITGFWMYFLPEWGAWSILWKIIVTVISICILPIISWIAISVVGQGLDSYMEKKLK